jgi:hypothetical protein
MGAQATASNSLPYGVDEFVVVDREAIGLAVEQAAGAKSAISRRACGEGFRALEVQPRVSSEDVAGPRGAGTHNVYYDKFVIG